ncbi:glycosyltransferase family 4 protein [Cellulomonas sp. GbtcB1]|uniref:glycosyltransferase family 4 protein n=1 Tax=Cellulomonas sp. GbtcB1 TaxID=2824746 RepID=UPI001C2F8BA4|nr:glycosyltransferase family 4 protein [Cellulomonas sp. GbtcB1]
MRILVYPGVMEVGGSQLNAVQLAHEVARAGHDVLMFGPDGDLVPLVGALGLEYVRAPQEGRWPSPRNMAALRRLVVDRGVDVVHGYEWGPSVDLAFGPHRRLGTPLVTTVLSMDVPDHVPTHEPLVVGTRRLHEQQRVLRDRVHLIEPPIDTERDAPGAAGPDARALLGLRPDDLVVSVVGRLSTDLGKADGVAGAIDVVGRLASGPAARARAAAGAGPLRLVVVGTGPEQARVAARADAVNAAAGEQVVVVTGQLLDPRAAYDAADVVLGMGSSVLRGMAFGKPVVVQGDRGAWRALTGDTLGGFLHGGWLCEGPGDGADLERELVPLLADPVLRAQRGALGRGVVLDAYGLVAAGRRQEAVYADAVAVRPSEAVRREALLRCAVDVVKFKASLARQRAVAGAQAWAGARAGSATGPGAGTGAHDGSGPGPRGTGRSGDRPAGSGGARPADAAPQREGAR